MTSTTCGIQAGVDDTAEDQRHKTRHNRHDQVDKPASRQAAVRKQSVAMQLSDGINGKYSVQICIIDHDNYGARLGA